jgi:hypothetical protein
MTRLPASATNVGCPIQALLLGLSGIRSTQRLILRFVTRRRARTRLPAPATNVGCPIQALLLGLSGIRSTQRLSLRFVIKSARRTVEGSAVPRTSRGNVSSTDESWPQQIADNLRLRPSPITAAKVSATLPFVIPSEAEGSAVPRTSRGNVFPPSVFVRSHGSTFAWCR